MPTHPPDDAWPTRESPTMVVRREPPLGGPPPPPPVGPPPPDRQFGMGLLLGLVALLLVGGGIAAAWFLTHRNDSSATKTVVVTTTPRPTGTGKVAVPRVVGFQQQRAVERLTRVGLEPKTLLRPAQGTPAGVVVSQHPLEATKLARGGQVTMVVSAGAPQVTVPDLRGGSLADARTKLTGLGLRPVTKQVSSTQAPGTIVDQSPAAGGKVRKGSAVTLTVAKAAPVAVPNVTGRQQAAATSALKAAGFTVNAVAVAAAQPSGQVVAQSPPAGAKAAKGSAVRINISDGSNAPQTSTTTKATTTTTTTTVTTTAAPPPPPAPTTASVPDVTGSDLRSAVQQLSGAGFLATIAYVPGQDPLGSVVAQSPSGGASAKTRSHVTVNASSGPGQKTQETVPDVTGQTLQQAVSTLNGAHLRLVFLKTPVTDRTQAGKVVEQTPAAGKQVPENAQVLVYLGAFRR